MKNKCDSCKYEIKTCKAKWWHIKWNKVEKGHPGDIVLECKKHEGQNNEKKA